MSTILTFLITLQIVTKIDNDLITTFPYENDWISLQKKKSPESITLVIPEIQLELTYIYHLWKFVLRTSSQIFPQTEGLCGKYLTCEHMVKSGLLNFVI